MRFCERKLPRIVTATFFEVMGEMVNQRYYGMEWYCKLQEFFHSKLWVVKQKPESTRKAEPNPNHKRPPRNGTECNIFAEILRESNGRHHRAGRVNTLKMELIQELAAPGRT